MPPENRLRFIAERVSGGINFARRYPLRAALTALPIIIVLGTSFINNEYIIPARQEEQRVQIQAQATATAIATDVLRRDYDQTGGVDLVRLRESFEVTRRGSASLARSQSELLDNIWVRIKRESGCEPVETLVLPGIPGTYPWDKTTPESYLVRVNC